MAQPQTCQGLCWSAFSYKNAVCAASLYVVGLGLNASFEPYQVVTA